MKKSKKQLNLNDLKVKSFVSSINSNQSIKGGRFFHDDHTTVHTDPELDPEHC